MSCIAFAYILLLSIEKRELAASIKIQGFVGGSATKIYMTIWCRRSMTVLCRLIYDAFGINYGGR